MARLPPVFQSHPMSFADARSHGCVRGVCHHVVDGDTLDMLLDLGWYHYAYVALRVAGIDTPEIRGVPPETKKAGLLAKARVEELTLGRCLLIRSHKHRMTFNRFVADVYIPSETPGLEIEGWASLKDLLITEGLAHAYP